MGAINVMNGDGYKNYKKYFFEGPFFATITTKSNLGTKTMFTVNKIKIEEKKAQKTLHAS